MCPEQGRCEGLKEPDPTGPGDKVQRQTSLDLLAEEKRQLHASMDPAQLMAPANDESRQHWDAVRRLAERIQETKKKSDCRDFRYLCVYICIFY